MRLHAESTRHGPLRVLILGGTTEAFQLASQLAQKNDIVTITSLAGRVRQPRMPEGIVRVGGFGGLSGLTFYLIEEKIGVMVDATHPFAAKISETAEIACDLVGIPLIALERPPWKPTEQDLWRAVPNAQAAAAMVNRKGNRVFLSIGRQELGAFSNCHDAWFLIRSIDEPEQELPLHSKLILDRGPFHLSEELEMLGKESIGFVVTKNSGGAATYSKIEAARALRIPVIMIARPAKHKMPTVPQVSDVLAILSRIFEGKQGRGGCLPGETI